MNYPIRFPFSSTVGRLGVSLSIQIDVKEDLEAGVYVATSKDISGLVLESETYAELKKEVSEAIINLLDLANNNKHFHTEADIVYKDHIAIA